MQIQLLNSPPCSCTSLYLGTSCLHVFLSSGNPFPITHSFSVNQTTLVCFSCLILSKEINIYIQTWLQRLHISYNNSFSPDVTNLQNSFAFMFLVGHFLFGSTSACCSAFLLQTSWCIFNLLSPEFSGDSRSCFSMSRGLYQYRPERIVNVTWHLVLQPSALIGRLFLRDTMQIGLWLFAATHYLFRLRLAEN